MHDSHRKKILLLVEGAKTDGRIMTKLFQLYDFDAKYEIIPYRTNIYVLYQEMFGDDNEDYENLDILQVLKAREKDFERKKIFDERYTDVLLVFDLDPQDPLFNAHHIRMMQHYFNESSDMGKLYLNYPMIEAFYHLSSIPDPNYMKRKAFIDELLNKTYKTRVHRETKGNDYSKFITSKEESNTVILQNLTKALQITTGADPKTCSIFEINNSVDLNVVLEKQLQHILMDQFVYVLCTCVFFIADYNPRLLLPDGP